MRILPARIVAFAAVACLACGLCACAPQQNEGAAQAKTPDEASEPVVVAWSMDGDCTVCHADEASSMNDSSCLASTHEAEGQTCADCHADEAALADVHASVDTGMKTAKKLKKTEVPSDVCLSCHDQAELAEKTADSTVLTDMNGTVANPHALPESDDHASLACADCHAMHSGEPASETAPDACASCHHSDVYECGTCHSV